MIHSQLMKTELFWVRLFQIQPFIAQFRIQALKNLESSQKREAERIHIKMPPKALYLSISSLIKNKQQEICMQEYKGTCDGTSWVP